MSYNPYDSSELCFKLRQEFGDWGKDDDLQPSREEVLKGELKSPSALEGGGFRFGVYELVGHGVQTNGLCGRFAKFLACTRVELHNKMAFDVKTGSLVNFAGMADVHPVFHSCDKPRCPVCYERGWAVREADNMTFRFKEIVKRLDHVAFGHPEHFIVSFPPEDWGKDDKELRKKALAGCFARGVVGGCIIPHFARFDKEIWRWKLGVHLHIIGYIRGGFRKCRGCSHVNDKGSRFFCEGCDGFYGVSKRVYRRDKLIVEVKGKRESIFGTAWYQLHHATVRIDRLRCHVVTWFGICSYRKMKIPKEARKEYNEENKPKCRICGGKITPHVYVGHDPNVLALYKKVRGAREKVERVYSNACDLIRTRERGSGSYEEEH